MSYHNIHSKNDRALMAYLISAGAGTAEDVYPAKRSQDKALPNTTCWSEESEHEGTGNYRIKTVIVVRTDPAEGETEGASRIASDARLSATADAMMTDVADEGTTQHLAELITAAARALAVADPARHADLEEYTCLACRFLGAEEGFDEAGAWVDTLNFEMVAVAADVS